MGGGPGHNRRGVEGGSSPWASQAGRKQEARSRRPRHVATANASTITPPAKHATTSPPVPAGGQGGRPPWTSQSAGGRRGVVPPGHHKQAGSRRPEAGGPDTWQRPTRAPSHPRPSTRPPRHQYRRGVEGGSSPLDITVGGGSKGGRPPGHHKQAGSRRPEAGGPDTWQRSTRAPSHPRPSTRPPRHQYRRGVRGVVPPGHHSRRGVEGGSSPLGITSRPEAGGPKPEAQTRGNGQREHHHTPGQARDHLATSTGGGSGGSSPLDITVGGGSKGGRPPWG
jgi:hypothetical protein